MRDGRGLNLDVTIDEQRRGESRQSTVLQADNPLFFASADYALRKCVRTRGTRAWLALEKGASTVRAGTNCRVSRRENVQTATDKRKFKRSIARNYSEVSSLFQCFNPHPFLVFPTRQIETNDKKRLISTTRRWMIKNSYIWQNFYIWWISRYVWINVTLSL